MSLASSNSSFAAACLTLCIACISMPIAAQAHAKQAEHDSVQDLSWARTFAIPYTTGSERVNAQWQDLIWDPRFIPTLRAAFPQHQWFWKDHGKFPLIPELAQLFLGVPGRSGNLGASAWLDEDRYVTAEGCVPHDCHDRGMLWIDTSKSDGIFFVATGLINTSDTTSSTHLWIYSSKPTRYDGLPSPFKASLKRWQEHELTGPYGTTIALVTLVPISGEMIDFSYNDLMRQMNFGAKK